MSNIKIMEGIKSLQAHLKRSEELLTCLEKGFVGYQDMVVRNTGYYHRRDVIEGTTDPVESFFNSLGRADENLNFMRKMLELIKDEVIEDGRKWTCSSSSGNF